MSVGRDRVLGDIRAALKRRGPLPTSVTSALEGRLKNSTPNLLPRIEGELIVAFARKVEAVHGILSRVSSMDEVSSVVLRHVEKYALPFEIVVAPDPALDGIPWSNRFTLARRAASGDDCLSVTSAFAGIAETGTLVLLSGPESPTTLNFLPEDHVVVVSRERIVLHMEDVWARIREERKRIPRTVNFITGPSKTADVELTIQEGAHGPRRLLVILVG
ncbi:MAG: lactate utilization protein [Gammaproteobacteria bacterium]|nr:lactate utilization protein [Gammaproteobacteria bacterium]